MKKILTFLLTGTIVAGMAACGGSSSSGTDSRTQASASGGSNVSGKYPAGTVTVTVPFNAGSNTDTQMRLIQQALETTLGQSIVVENDGGASGTIGTNNFLQKAQDGSNILFSLPTPTLYKPLTGETTYTTDDLIPTARISQAAMYLVVKEGGKFDIPAKDLIQYIKDNPDSFTYANAGNSGIAQLAFGVFLNGEGLHATSVPFTGGTADEYTALMGDTVNSYVCGEQEWAGREGVKAVINLGTKSDDEGKKDIPTLADLGYDGYVTDNFSGFYFGKDTDPAMVQEFSDAAEKAFTSDDFKKSAKESQFQLNFAGAEEFQKQVNTAIETLQPVMQEMGQSK